MSLKGIADFLFAQGIPLPRGKPQWTQAVISGLLSNHRYIGSIISFDEFFMVQGEKGKRSYRRIYSAFFTTAIAFNPNTHLEFLRGEIIMNAIWLRTEYLNNPIGIEIPRPRLFWNCEGGARQTAYQITAAVDGQTAWDSGRVESSQMTHAPYGGALASQTRMEWKVRLWDENGAEGPRPHRLPQAGAVSDLRCQLVL